MRLLRFSTRLASVLLPALAPPLALSLLSPPLPAQRPESQIREDLAFARGLESTWGFSDLSESLLLRLEHEPTTGLLADDIHLLRCDLHALRAARTAAPTERENLQRTALADYAQYLDTHPTSQNLPRAEAAYVDTALLYGRTLWASAEDAAPAERAALVKELQDALVAVASRTAAPANDLRNRAQRSEAEDRRLFELLLDRAALLGLIARSQDDGSFNFAQARTLYEQVVDQAGETSPAGLRAFVGIGELLLATGKPEDAYACFAFVGDVAIPRDAAAWRAEAQELAPAELQRRFALLQLATPGLLQALLALHDAPKACAEGLRLLQVERRNDLELVPTFGPASLAGLVDALDAAGGFVGGDLESGELEWFASAEAMRAKFPEPRRQRTSLELALALAQRVLEADRGGVQGARAQRRIGELIEKAGGDVPTAILIEVARGAAEGGDFQGATLAYKRVLAALESGDAALRAQQAPGVLGALARCYQALDRQLEAALAFQEALARTNGDGELDARNANGFYASAHQLARGLPNDAPLEALAREADRAKLEHPGVGGGAGVILWDQAARAYDAKNWLVARELFRSVPAGAESFEKALVYAAVCDYQLGKETLDFTVAIRALDAYLDEYVKDPRHALAPQDARKAQRRSEAEAVAVLYRGLAELALAEAGKGDWKRVLALLGDYEARFPERAELAPAALHGALVAHGRLGELEAMEALLAKLRARFPEDRWTVMSALDVYDLLEAEVARTRAVRDPAERARWKELARRRALLLEFANEKASVQSFGNLRRESQAWMELEEWAKAEALLKRIADKFSAGAEAESVQKFILPDLGTALFRQQKLQETVDVLWPLVERQQATQAVTWTCARALSGYAEPVDAGGRRSMRVVPGVGGIESFAKAIQLYTQLLETERSSGAGAWTPAWLALKSDQLWCWIQWSKLDSKKLESARAQVKLLQTEFDGAELPGLADADLRARFQWLIDQVE